jgi:hypothetical protein
MFVELWQISSGQRIPGHLGPKHADAWQANPGSDAQLAWVADVAADHSIVVGNIEVRFVNAPSSASTTLPVVDKTPDDLDQAIRDANSIAELKTALLGRP